MKGKNSPSSNLRRYSTKILRFIDFTHCDPNCSIHEKQEFCRAEVSNVKCKLKNQLGKNRWTECVETE